MSVFEQTTNLSFNNKNWKNHLNSLRYIQFFSFGNHAIYLKYVINTLPLRVSVNNKFNNEQLYYYSKSSICIYCD